jgi:hypothetical protein
MLERRKRLTRTFNYVYQRRKRNEEAKIEAIESKKTRKKQGKKQRIEFEA